MPPGKRRQSNAMLYTLITFVALFVAATTVAVIYYVKAEELRTTAKDAQDDLNEMASTEEVRNVGAIIGTKLRGATNLGSLLQYFDQMTGFVTGTPVAATSAEVKVSSLKDQMVALLDKAQLYVTLPAPDPNAADPNLPDPNRVSLTTLAADLLSGLEQTTNEKDALAGDLQKLQGRLDDATASWQATEQDLTAKVEEYKQQVDQTKGDYDELRSLLQESSDQQIATLQKRVEDLRTESRQRNQDLLRTQAELGVAQQRLADALADIKKTQPDPNEKAVAAIPDGKIILIDEAAGVVHIDLGSDDRIYRGLTFSVYDKASGVSADDEPKAEIEVFAITEKTAAARILSSKKRNPIATDDVITNLIWDVDKGNQFVIAGSFDLDGDTKPDYDAPDRLGALIRRWGGAVSDTVSAQTNYVVIGTEPVVPSEPTFEQETDDPEARTRYNQAKAMSDRYNEVLQKAKTFYIPTITYERFLYLIGYQSQVGKPGAL